MYASISLSLYTYVYIYIYIHMFIHTYLYMAGSAPIVAHLGGWGRSPVLWPILGLGGYTILYCIISYEIIL